MADKIAKILAKLPRKDLIRIQQALKKIQLREFTELDIKMIKGSNETFRVRVGNFRIIFKISGNNIYLIKLDKRNENTYKDI